MKSSALTPPDTLSFSDVRLRFVQVIPGDASKGFVPAYHFRILNPDGSDTGHINFRIGDTEHVHFCAGHIGFEILEEYRGRRYAYQACRAIAPFVRSVYGGVIITCDPHNFASRRTAGIAATDCVRSLQETRFSWRGMPQAQLSSTAVTEPGGNRHFNPD